MVKKFVKNYSNFIENTLISYSRLNFSQFYNLQNRENLPRSVLYEKYQKFPPNLVRQGFYRWLNRYFLFLQIPLAIILYLIGGWSWVIYGMFVQIPINLT
jgi:fatty-acid desaturase